MPFVNIDVIKGRRSPEQLKRMGDVIQQVLIDTFAAPERDKYRVCELYLSFIQMQHSSFTDLQPTRAMGSHLLGYRSWF